MRKIVFHLTTNTTGTDAWEFYEFPDDVTDEELDDFAWDLAKDNAEMYGIYPLSEYEDLDDYSEEELDSDSYDENIDGTWYDYNPEKHDGHRSGALDIWEKGYV